MANMFWFSCLMAATAVAFPQHLSGNQSFSLEHLNTLSARDLPIGTCNAATPCPNGACCGSNGLCGYAPAECGSGCLSNCNAKAECGQYGTPGQQNCPLNVCCSQFGFCGSTNDFCGTGCQQGYGGCGSVPRPSCGGSQVGRRTIGYYESWASTRTCQAVQPEDLNLSGFTHINFAFAFFDPSSFKITPMDSNSASLYGRFTALKDKYPGLQAWISVGGWSFTDPGPTRQAFSTMTSSSGNRAAFINSLISFMNQYGFDGIDLDWEYPQADDRGGQNGDTQNYVALARELKAALGPKGLSMTLPTSYWYLRHFDVNSLQQYVDWFNFMSYDLHGTWDAQSKFVGPYIAPHTNLTEIDQGLDLLWRAGVQSNKVVLGMGWYGRSFTLASSSCNTPNGVCQFTGGANPGPCSGTSGILDDQEIANIISQNNLQPTWDHTAGVKWITWNSNQWVSYDDADTFNQKKDFANSRCLGGLMVWAIDQKDQTTSNGLGSAPGVTSDQQSNAQSMANDALAQASCYATDCNVKCKKGTNQVAQVNGQPGQISVRDRCPSGQYRNVCCNDGTIMGKCQWRGFRGAGLSCIQGCAQGETEVLTDTSVHNGNKDSTCNGGLQSYCCLGFKPPPTKGQVKQAAEDAAKDAAEQAAEQAALDIAAKAFCRIAVPALLAPLEALEDLIPIFGEIADIAEIAATPALINLCVKGIEKEGKAEFKVFGKKKTLSLNEPSKPPQTRPPKSSHSSEKTSSSTCNSKRGAADRPCRYSTTTKCRGAIRTEHPGINRVCDYARFGQACAHYQSVGNLHHINAVNNHGRGYNPLTCPYETKDVARPAANIVSLWMGQHNSQWWQGYIQQPNQFCQADEYPPYAYFQDQNFNSQYIRLLPQTDNGGAGAALFNLAPCSYQYYSHDVGYGTISTFSRNAAPSGVSRGAGLDWSVFLADCTITAATVYIQFRNSPAAWQNEGLVTNPCYPSTLINDPGFALLTNDDYYIVTGANYAATARGGVYARPPGTYTNGKPARAGYSKRDEPQVPELGLTGGGVLVYNDGNSTHRMDDAAVARVLGIDHCMSAGCADELRALYEASQPQAPPTSPRETLAEATPAAGTEAVQSRADETKQPMAGSAVHDVLKRDMPQATNLPG